MKKWRIRFAFVLLAAGVIALAAVSVHFCRESRSYQDSLASEYRSDWMQLEKVTDLAASLYGENLLPYGELDTSAVELHVVMAVNYLDLSPEVREDDIRFYDFVRGYYCSLVSDLDDPELAADAMPLFQEMNHDLHELSRDMVERYQEAESSGDMLNPESAAYQNAAEQIRAFMEKYIDPLSGYLGMELF